MRQFGVEGKGEGKSKGKGKDETPTSAKGGQRWGTVASCPGSD